MQPETICHGRAALAGVTREEGAGPREDACMRACLSTRSCHVAGHVRTCSAHAVNGNGTSFAQGGRFVERYLRK